MEVYSSQDIDILTAIIFNENLISKSSSIHSIKNSCDMYNRVSYYRDDIKETLLKLISTDIVVMKNEEYKISKNFRRIRKEKFKKAKRYFEIYDELKTLLSS